MELKKIQRSSTCLNCGLALNADKDNFCPSCGQLNNTKKETALGLVRELVGDFLHLDSKVSRSLLPLLFRPGYLTKEYISGRRVRYFHPVRMFLTLTVILFIVTGLQKNNEPRSSKVTEAKAVSDSTMQAVQNSEAIKDTSSYNASESQKNGRQGNGNMKEQVTDDVTLQFDDLNVNFDTLRSMIDAGNMDNEEMMDQLGIKKNIFSRIMFAQIVSVHKQGFEKLRDYYASKLPWMLFALMPVFAFVMYLLYVRKRIYFVDHLIYAFHLHSAAFLVMSLVGLLQWLTGWDTSWLLLYIPGYYYVSLNHVYGQPWFISFAKGTLAGIVYLLLGLFVLLLVASVMFLLF